jgi:hypothetical protein
MKITHTHGFVETKAGRQFGPVIRFESILHCPRCGCVVGDQKMACAQCIEHGEPRKKQRYVKPKPGDGGLSSGQLKDGSL